MQSKVGKVRKFPPKISILVHPKQILVVSKSEKQKNKKKSSLLIFIPFPLQFLVFLHNFPSPFSPFPFFLASLFRFLLFFSLPSIFSSSIISPFLPKFPPNFPRVGDSPTLPTPSFASGLCFSLPWWWVYSAANWFNVTMMVGNSKMHLCAKLPAKVSSSFSSMYLYKRDKQSKSNGLYSYGLFSTWLGTKVSRDFCRRTGHN